MRSQIAVFMCVCRQLVASLPREGGERCFSRTTGEKLRLRGTGLRLWV